MKIDSGIRITKSHLISEIESFFKELQDSDKEKANLLISTNLTENKLGIRASLCQFIVTWAKQTNCDLYTFVNNEIDVESYLKNLCEEFHGLTSILMSLYPRNRKIYNQNGTIDLTHKAINIAREYMIRMVDANDNKTGGMFPVPYSKGNKIALFCFDHLTNMYRFLPWFYYKNNEIRKEEDFHDLIEQILNQIIVYNSHEYVNLHKNSQRESLVNFKRTIGSILYELFDNTDKWATTGIKEDKHVISMPNLRGVIMEYHYGDINLLLKSAEGSAPLIEYLNNPIFKSQKNLNFIEMSVLDSGPGLSQRWNDAYLSDEYSLEKEYIDIMTCLSAGQTSDMSSMFPDKGRGLYKTLRLCGGKGFLRIRSGRLSLYRNFIDAPFYEDEYADTDYCNLNNKMVFDWQTGSNELTKFSFAQGTLYTIIYPLFMV